MNVIHLTEFGKLKYIHVTIDTFSRFIIASLQAREASINVIVHVLSCLSVMGKPKIIKTNNGPGYIGKNLQQSNLHNLESVTIWVGDDLEQSVLKSQVHHFS